MNKLLVHPTTEYQLKSLINSNPHAVLVSGNKGLGKETIAQELINSLSDLDITKNPYFLKITPEHSSIGISEIRHINEFLNRKTPGKTSLRRFILILDAQTMTDEAQNAILKTLEEPPDDTMIVLTTDDVTSLKSTIRSRAQQLQVLPVDERSAQDHFKDKAYSESAIRSAFHMSDGRPGLMASLLKQSSEHTLVQGIIQAKAILTMSVYDRLKLIEGLNKQKDSTNELLWGLERVVLTGLRQEADNKNEGATRKFYDISRCIADAQDKLAKNVNTKLVLTDLFLKI